MASPNVNREISTLQHYFRVVWEDAGRETHVGQSDHAQCDEITAALARLFPPA